MAETGKSRSRRQSCSECGKRGTTRRPISKRGYCPSCGEARAVYFAGAMAARSGPAYEKWLASMARVGQDAARRLDS